MRNAIVIVALAGLAGLTSADTVANWNFNDQGLPAGGFGFQTSDFPQNADVGTGLFTIGNFNGDNTAGVYNWVQSFAGTTTAAIGGASSGGSCVPRCSKPGCHQQWCTSYILIQWRIIH